MSAPPQAGVNPAGLVPNLRDLGGFSLAQGGVTRSGVLFRSEAPNFLSEADRRGLDQIQLVLDLRSPGEGAAREELWFAPHAPETVALPLWSNTRLSAEAALEMCRDEEVALDYMERTYREIVEALPRVALAEVAHRLGEREQVPALIHCTGGQDRTGVLVAVLLLVLGASREAVLEDYARTTLSWDLERMSRHMQAMLGAEERDLVDTAVGRIVADPRYLEGALAQIESSYGSVAGYWAAGGVDSAAVERMRRVLCVAPAFAPVEDGVPV
ncbi:tyrosine-protein phosphatase [Sporichthya polymorpha]|uniref:tyrosine-protein phosphatase n=1 Tax=Sporichthya polymorpha TaxID=35751 RepID=UPI0003672852|nr:tyrosine-protein phosphatase [Sporichthya polymorpha]